MSFVFDRTHTLLALEPLQLNQEVKGAKITAEKNKQKSWKRLKMLRKPAKSIIFLDGLNTQFCWHSNNEPSLKYILLTLMCLLIYEYWRRTQDLTASVTFTALNRAPFDFFFQESGECVFGRHVGLAPSTSAVMNSLDDGRLPTWPPGGHPDGEDPERVCRSQRCVDSVIEKL